jgi:hypothetical protein
MSAPMSESPSGSAAGAESRTIIWIDHHKARLFVSSAGGKLAKTDVLSDRRAGRASGSNVRYANDDDKYLNAVMAAIPAAGDILIIGPAGQTKDELVAHLKQQQPAVAERIRGVETSTATSDGQLLARAKAFWAADKAAGRPER